MNGPPRKRSINIAGHTTSVTLEDAFWQALKAIAVAQGRSTMSLVAKIDAERGTAGLSSAIRVYVLRHFMDR